MTGPGIHGTDPRREPLDPGERELAARLARSGPHGEPPAAVDERILAAAHAATSASPRRARRLPLALGVAASLVLALGLAWQLRPLLDDPPPPVESERMDMAAPADGSQAAAPASAPVGPGSAAGGDAAEARSAAREAGPERKAAAATDAAEPPPRSARRAPTPQAFPAPAAPSPPPPAPPPAPTAPVPVAPTAAPTAPAPIAETGAAEAEDARLRRQSTESQRSFDQDRDATTQAMQEPAATGEAGSRDAEAQLRQAQLARIRALRDAGHTAQARDELEAFLERWPGYPVPDDLHALLR
jgi:resuscitation-promoting factor RpfA